MLIQILHARADRIIAIGRAAIAVFALAAIWIDPSQPASMPGATYGLLVAYLAFAGSVLVASRREFSWSGEFSLVTHFVDLTVFSLLLFLTEGPTGPFFLLFTFSLISATLRWSWRGALWTSVAVIMLLVVIATLNLGLAANLPLEVDRFIMRCAHIVVIGAMLVYLGFRYERLAEEASRLATWQPGPGQAADLPALLEVCLGHVADVLEAPRTLLVLNSQDETWPTIAEWNRGKIHCEPLIGDVETLVAKPLTGASFIHMAGGSVLVWGHKGQLHPWRGRAIGPALTKYGMNQLLAVPFLSDHATGWLFVVDRPGFAHEHLVLAKLLAAQVAIEVDRLQVIEAARQSATTEERLHLARDLHDGILQSLAGTALQLETVKILLERDPASVRTKICDIQAWLLHEQGEMRGFITKLRPADPPPPLGWAEQLVDVPALARALEQQWGVEIKLAAEAAILVLPADLQFQARQIIREAVANAVRHGGASEVTLEARQDDSRLSLKIADNGKGLPAHGQFDERQCARARLGPRSLRERIVGLGGSMRVDSTPGGLTLSIDLPVNEQELSQ